MSKLVLTASLLAVLAIAACSPAAGEPSVSPSVAPSPSAPIAEPPASGPLVTPAPSPTDPPSKPAPGPSDPPDRPDPAIVEFTADEMFLVDGIRRGVMDCEPVRERLPEKALAGIECIGDDPGVARVGFYLFETDDDMLDHYFVRLRSAGVTPESGGCADGSYEGAYIPGEEEVASRNACFINEQGYANYRFTLPGEHVYIGVLGSDADTLALANFAWRFNTDIPGNPTLWASPRA